MSRHTPAEKFVRRSSFLLIALFAVAVLSFKTIHHPAHAQTAGGTRLLRTPTVSATQIGFAYAQNIWTVPRAGGMARRITTFQGQTSNPHFSPDGKWIAFSGEYAGNLDVYVVAADGGEPKRLTWHPGADTVQGWTPDGRSVQKRGAPLGDHVARVDENMIERPSGVHPCTVSAPGCQVRRFGSPPSAATT